mgnify:CR=1 FL=1
MGAAGVAVLDELEGGEQGLGQQRRRAGGEACEATPGRYRFVDDHGVFRQRGAEHRPNVPGTIDEHPNWRRRARLTMEELADDERANELLAALNAARQER